MLTSRLRATLGSLLLAGSLLSGGSDLAPASASTHVAAHPVTRADVPGGDTVARWLGAEHGVEHGVERSSRDGRPDLSRAQMVRAAASASGAAARSARGARAGLAPFTIPIGNASQGVTVDASMHTAYAANGGDGTVSVIDTAICNAHVTARCGDTPPVISLGDPNAFPVEVVRVAATHTLYTTNAGDNTVSVIDTATCNAVVTTSCSQTPPRITVGNQPVDAAFDPATHTLYTANFGDGTVSMIDTATCDATVVSGCGQTPTEISFGALQPSGLFLDASTGTLYVANLAVGSNESEPDALSIVDTATCNAQISTGCIGPFPSVTVGSGSNDQNVAFALDQPSHTLFVANYTENTISLVNIARCTASDSSGCAQPAPAVPAVGGGTTGFVLNPATHTLYEVQNGDNTIAVVAVATCNAHHDGGCARPVGLLRAGIGSSFAALDPAMGSLYVVNTDAGDVSVINAATCNATETSGCGMIAPAAAVGNGPDAIAINPRTHTAYVANYNDNSLSLINTRNCTAASPAGCAATSPTTAAGDGPNGVAVDPATDTIYVADIATDGTGNTVSVLDGADCNATTRTGCGPIAATVEVGKAPGSITLDPARHTAYVINGNDNTVSVLNTTTCNATDTTGCRAAATIPVGRGPLNLLVNDATHTAYVSNYADNTLSLIDTATCNASDTRSCAATHPTAVTGDGPIGLALDPTTSTLYVVNNENRTISMLDAASCTTTNTTSCGQTPPVATVGDGPTNLVLVPKTHALYVSDRYDNSVAVIDTRLCNHERSADCHHEPASFAVGNGPIAVARYRHTLYFVTGLEPGLDNDVSLLSTQK